MKIDLKSVYETRNLSRKISRFIKFSINIYLSGSLGSGKTTFAKGLISFLGYRYLINSPTFAIVKRYETFFTIINHFDFYRVCNSKELDQLGINDYFNAHCINLIEWPEKAKSKIPRPDLILNFTKEQACFCFYSLALI